MKFINKTVLSIGLIVLAFSFAGSAQTTKKAAKPKPQYAKVLISEKGYEPGTLKLKRGVPAKVTFLRTTENTCGTEIVIPAYGINKPLPLNEKVVVSFTPKKAGEFKFTCGMNMMRGKLVVL
ncbi:cupredoxin domain-containing protein [soil metagenome]